MGLLLTSTRRIQDYVSKMEFMGISGSLVMLVIEVQSAIENRTATAASENDAEPPQQMD